MLLEADNQTAVERRKPSEVVRHNLDAAHLAAAPHTSLVDNQEVAGYNQELL